MYNCMCLHACHRVEDVVKAVVKAHEYGNNSQHIPPLDVINCVQEALAGNVRAWVLLEQNLFKTDVL